MRRVVNRILTAIMAFAMIISLSAYPAKAAITTTNSNNTAIKANQIDITVGQDEEGNVTVTYGRYTFIRKYNGWYIPAAYIYNGSELANFLDKAVRRTRRTSVRCDGFLFIKVSGGWYRHELHVNDGRTLATLFNKAAGIKSTYDPNNLNSEDATKSKENNTTRNSNGN
ncbi:hypothetical protein [Butyrivibrio sp. LC3010]|uniref:hypothetical protein n=1 Tax=Butyrivibrio sp. LC3010 TaxID=1280680 RepID=UPI00041614C2|nr:hypothetical protein [Butyrivibrio sp. LC3010]